MILSYLLKNIRFVKRKKEMRKGFKFKAKLFGLALLATGAAAAVPAAIPQTVMAAEPAAGTQSTIPIPYGAGYRIEDKTISRTAHFMYRNEDGSTAPVIATTGEDLHYSATATIQKITVYNKKTGAVISTHYSDPIEFPAWDSPDLYGYTPDKEEIPAKTITWDDESEDIYVYYTKDVSKESIEEKEFSRKIHTVYKDTDGSVIYQNVQTQNAKIMRYVWTDKYGNKTYGNWGKRNVSKIDVTQTEGYRVDKTVIPAITLSSPDDKFDDVYITYTKRPTNTETKKITRKINLLGNNADGSTSNLGSMTQSVTLSRIVYADTNGAEEVKTDWNTGKFAEYTVPDVNGYIKPQNKVSEVTVTSNSENTEVNIYYNEKAFKVMYHLDDSAIAASEATTVKYGVSTKTKSISDLGFSKTNQVFVGWKAYRECDDKWYMTDNNGKNSFKKLVNGKLPANHTFYLYRNGQPVSATASSGLVHFYAQWKAKEFTVQYHLDDNSSASDKTTNVTYGNSTKTLTVSELGFSKSNKKFAGWKAYRDCDDKWYMTDGNGKHSFKKLVNGKLPANHTFYLYRNGQPVSATASSGIVHFYAQWK